MQSTKAFVLAVVLTSASALAQTVPLGLPMFNDPPELNGAPVTVRPSGILKNLDRDCVQKVQGLGWVCLATVDNVAAAKSEAVTLANNNTASQLTGYATTSALSGAVATLNSNITTAANTAQTNAQNTAASNLASAVATLNAKDTAQDAVSAALDARITQVQNSIPVVTPDTVCGSTTVTGLSIPLTGISSTTTLTVPGALTGSPCVVGGASFLPLGAYAVCAVTAANTVQVRFQGGGLLSSVINIPNGTYKACALIRP